MPTLPPFAQWTPEIVTGILAPLLSLIFAYWPGLNDQWAALSGVRKRQYTLVAICAIAVVGFVAGCITLPFSLPTFLESAQYNAPHLLRLIFLSAVANQTTFTLAVRPRKVAGG